MTIQVWSYLREYEAEKDDILGAVDKVFSSGQLILGESVRRFEAEFSAFCGVRHGIGVDNGTNAVALALRAVGVKPGDEVVTVSNTAAPTVVAIDSIGARARFVDIDRATYLMDTRKLEAAITPKTTCIVPVHLFGQCVDMDAVNAVAAKRGLRVVEDCAQSHGARFRGKPAGSMSNAAAFSFYPTKVLGAYGDGGMVVTNDDEVARAMRRLRYYGMEDRYYVVGPGTNSRLDEVQAEILRRKLGRIETYIERRRAIAARYGAELSGLPLTLPREIQEGVHVYYLYVVRHPRRDAILDALKEKGILLNVSYRWPVHTMTGFSHLGYRPGDLPETEAAANEIFSLPMFPSLTDEEQTIVCDTLRDVLAKI
jgi:aminotransferase EvaB